MVSPRRVGLAIVVVAAVGAWLPEPFRGVITMVAGLGGPTWAFGPLVRRHLGVTSDLAWALGAILTLATWSLGMLALLLVGIHLARPVVLVLLAAAVLVPLWLATGDTVDVRDPAHGA
jgi:hypothetical protein